MSAAAVSERFRPSLPAVLALCAIAVGTWVRLDGALACPLFGDEFHAGRTAAEDLATVLTTFDELGSHVALPLLQWCCAQLLGRSMLAFRLPALVPGVLALLLVYPVARALVGRAAAALATVGLALAPMHVYYTRFARSYALTVFLGLALLGLLRAAPSRRRTVGLVAAAGLLPWVHLSSVGYLVALGVAALLPAGGEREPRARTLVPLLLGALLCAALYWPVRASLADYLALRADGPHDRPTTFFGIPLLLGGGVVGGVALLAGVPLGLVALARAERRSALLLAGAVAGPLALLLTTRPHGMEYAWSRYLLTSLPAALMLLGAAWMRGLARLWPGAGGERGALLLGVAFLVGMLGLPRRAHDAPFSNTYLAMHDLPAFDAPDPGRSPFYDRLAADDTVRRIVEVPDMHSRALLLYRNRRLVHGKDVLLGLATAKDDSRLRGGPYVFLSRRAAITAGAQVVVLHKDLVGELDAYWDFVYGEAWPAHRTFGDAGLMERHRTYYLVGSDPAVYAAGLRPALDKRFGEPVYEDDVLVAWQVPE